jgi:hypothetical protein
MKKLLMGLAALPFITGVAWAGQPLTADQMDRVTAGYMSIANAAAEGTAGESGEVITTTATLSEVLPIASHSTGEFSSTLYKAISAAQSSSASVDSGLCCSPPP